MQEEKCLMNVFILLKIIFLRNTKLNASNTLRCLSEIKCDSKEWTSPIQGDELDIFFPNVPHPTAIKDNDKPLLTTRGNCLAFYQG